MHRKSTRAIERVSQNDLFLAFFSSSSASTQPGNGVSLFGNTRNMGGRGSPGKAHRQAADRPGWHAGCGTVCRAGRSDHHGIQRRHPFLVRLFDLSARFLQVFQHRQQGCATLLQFEQALALSGLATCDLGCNSARLRRAASSSLCRSSAGSLTIPPRFVSPEQAARAIALPAFPSRSCRLRGNRQCLLATRGSACRGAVQNLRWHRKQDA